MNGRQQPILFYVVDWLPPDFGAVGQYGLNIATELAGGGRHVCLIGLTSGSPRRTKWQVGHGTLETIRLPASTYNKTRLADRLVWTFRANLRLLWEVIRRRDSYKAEMLFTGSPPFFLYFAVAAKLMRRMRLTYRITDFYPEVIIAELGRQPLPLRLLQAATWFMRRRVDRFEALGFDQQRLLLKGGISASRISIKRDASPVAISGREPPVPPPPELADRKVLFYSGNYGVPHEVETVIAGWICHYRDGSGRVGLWLNATGRHAERLETELRSAGIPLARSGTVPLDRLPALLMAADAHLITLRPEFAGIVLPSKVYACIASGRPIVFVGPQTSDVHRLCLEGAAAGYVRIEPGDIQGFAEALEHLAGSDSKYISEPVGGMRSTTDIEARRFRQLGSGEGEN